MNSRSDYLPDLYIKEGLFEQKYKLKYPENFEYDFIHNIHSEKIKNYLIKPRDGYIEVIFQFEDGYEIVTQAFNNSWD